MLLGNFIIDLHVFLQTRAFLFLFKFLGLTSLSHLKSSVIQNMAWPLVLGLDHHSKTSPGSLRDLVGRTQGLSEGCGLREWSRGPHPSSTWSASLWRKWWLLCLSHLGSCYRTGSFLFLKNHESPGASKSVMLFILQSLPLLLMWGLKPWSGVPAVCSWVLKGRFWLTGRRGIILSWWRCSVVKIH